MIFFTWRGWVFSAITYLCLMLVGVSAGVAQTTEVAVTSESPIAVPNPSTDLWNAVRERSIAPKRTQSKSIDATSMVNASGEEWRQFRRNELIQKGSIVLIAVLCVVVLLFLIKPATYYEGGESNRKIRRFNIAKMVGHWMMAVVMLFLGLTGLVLLFGRFALLPWMGPDFFSALASASKEGHDLFGPIFTFSLILFFVQFVRRNLPAKGDLKWLLTLGGRVGSKHMPAGFFNAGEKMLFWMVILFGLILSITGFAILFQNLIPGRDLMQLLIVVHAISAILLVCVVLGHIYMALSFKGTLEAMRSGDVDANWAKSHHSNWFEDMEAAGKIFEKPPVSSAINKSMKSEVSVKV